MWRELYPRVVLLATLDAGLVRAVCGEGRKERVTGSMEAFCKATSEDPSL